MEMEVTMYPSDEQALNILTAKLALEEDLDRELDLDEAMEEFACFYLKHRKEYLKEMESESE